MNTVTFLLDGKLQSVRFTETPDYRPTTTVLQYLRSLPDRKGTKEGCAEGDCGACTVVVAEPDKNGGLTYKVVDSCLLFLPMIHGKQLITVESLSSSGRLHPVQSSVVEAHASQCGYCTPGIVMSMFGLYKNCSNPSRAAIDDAMTGTLCRCTGYRPIVDAAVRSCAPGGQDKFTEETEDSLDLLHEIADVSLRIETGDQQYFRPRTLREALVLRAQYPQAALVSGASDVALSVTKKHVLIEKIIDLSAVTELKEVIESDDKIILGAGLSLEEVVANSEHSVPALHSMLNVFGSPQIRNVATLGGNLGTASPIGDTLPVLLACEAKVFLESIHGRRKVEISHFFTGYRKSLLRKDEIITAIKISKTIPHNRIRSYKISKRKDLDISTLSACLRIETDRGLKISKAVLAFGGMAEVPRRAEKTERFLTGKAWTRETIESAFQVLDLEFRPISDVRGSEDFRRTGAKNLLLKYWNDLETTPTMEMPTAGPTGVAHRDEGTHESAVQHVTGSAVYVDDMPVSEQLLCGHVVYSPHAHAKIVSMDVEAALAIEGVRAVMTCKDIPGVNQMGPVVHDEPCLAETTVHCAGQVVCLIAGDNDDICRAAAEALDVRYELLDPVLEIEDAMARDCLIAPARKMERGDVDNGFRQSEKIYEGEFKSGAQEHWYLETQCAVAVPGEGREMTVYASSQHPTETQAIVAEVLGIQKHEVTVDVRRMGGAFGGKETQANHVSVWAALLAGATRSPVKIRLFRDDDQIITGKRHRFLSRYKVGTDNEGTILAAEIGLNADAGCATDLTMAILERAMMHVDNAYFIPNIRIVGRAWKTNLPSNTAFRGFGGPQGMAVIENVIDRISRELGKDPAEVRRLNLYGTTSRNVTPYGETVEFNRLPEIMTGILESSEYGRRRQELTAFNETSEFFKKGLALSPVKFGISFTTSFLNQAGALVNIYKDGSVLVNHGGTEMGQGLHTKIRLIAAREFGIPVSRVKVNATNTSKVPNTSATAASAGTDLNGAAVKNAIDQLKFRLARVAAQHFSDLALEVPSVADDIVFEDDSIYDMRYPKRKLTFSEIMPIAVLKGVSLSATGFYKTPNIGFDREKGTGRPFHYYAFGAAVTEVLVDTLTGRHTILRTDILHDVGDSIHAAIDVGQIEGGYIQGVGWCTTEEIKWDGKGRLLSHSPDTYKIPNIQDIPRDFRVTLLPNATNPGVIQGSKAVAEPPFMLALSCWLAIKDAVSAVDGHRSEPPLFIPATNEAILMACEQLRMARKEPATVL